MPAFVFLYTHEFIYIYILSWNLSFTKLISGF